MNRKFISNSNYVLRKVLNSKENLDIIKDFIESFLNIEIQKIELNPYLKSKEKYLPSEEKFGIANVRIETKEKEEFNIGIQFIDGYFVENKLLLYYLQIHSNQLEYDAKRKFAKTITINLLDFNFFKADDYHQKLFIKTNPDSNGNREKLEMHVIELPKFNNKNLINMNRENAWMMYLCGNNGKLISEITKKYEKINKLNDLLNKYWQEEVME